MEINVSNKTKSVRYPLKTGPLSYNKQKNISICYNYT